MLTKENIVGFQNNVDNILFSWEYIYKSLIVILNGGSFQIERNRTTVRNSNNNNVIDDLLSVICICCETLNK